MTSEKRLSYARPVEPADPDAEYLTIQETAWIFRCSVRTIRRRLNQDDAPHSRIGRRIVFSREDRRTLYDMCRVAASRTRGAGRSRRRRTAVPRDRSGG